jgi:hypothetical protein
MEFKEHIKENDDGSVTVDFSDRPVKMEGGEVKELVLREPTVQDQMTARKWGKNEPAASEVFLISSLAERSPEDIRVLTLKQYGRLQDALIFFTG